MLLVFRFNPHEYMVFEIIQSFSESRTMMREEPEKFKEEIYATLRRHATALNHMTEKKGMYFFDYGNAACGV